MDSDLNLFWCLSSQQLNADGDSTAFSCPQTLHESKVSCIKNKKTLEMADSSNTIEQFNSQTRHSLRIPKQRTVVYEKRIVKRKCPELNQFTVTEDKRILELVREYGTRFCVISRLLPDKSIYAIKNRYYKVLRYKQQSVLNWNPRKSLQQRKNKEVDQLASLKSSAAKLGLFNETKSILFSFLHQLQKQFS